MYQPRLPVSPALRIKVIGSSVTIKRGVLPKIYRFIGLPTIKRVAREGIAVWEYRTDTTRNRLYLAVNGSLSTAEVPTMIRGVVQAMNLLKPGFSIISDLSDLLEDDAEGSKLLSTMEEAAQRFGVNRVIYVRPVLSCGHQPKSWPCVSFQGSEARSLEEAKRMLGDSGDTV